MNKIYPFLVAFLVLFTACTPTPNDGSMPSWVMNASPDGKTGAIGVAGRTYDQSLSSQRKLAIARALDELALQTKVKVTLSMQKKEHATNSESHLSVNENSTYKATGTLTAHIEDIWMDENSHELYVWMLLD